MHAITFNNIEVMNLKESKEGCMRVFGRRKGKNKMQLNYNFKKTLLIQACNFSRVCVANYNPLHTFKDYFFHRTTVNC